MEQRDDIGEVLADAPAGGDAPEAQEQPVQAVPPGGAASVDAPDVEAAAPPEPGVPPAQPVPGLSDEERRFNERLHMSESVLREQHGDADVDAKLEAFRREAARDPGLGAALGAALREQAHPWAWMYRQAQRALALEEIGADPDAYRSRVREEVRAELAQQARPARPPSLAAGRSSAPRSAAWAGPAALDDILRR